MIHLLTVCPEITPKELSKLARRYAMTGGYEIQLKEGLSSDELAVLADRYSEILERDFSEPDSRSRSSNAYRILELIESNSESEESTSVKIRELLGRYSPPAGVC